METFNFCPNSYVPETIVRDATDIVSLNGWQFTSRPTTPYQRKFKLVLHGLQWYTNSTTGIYDSTTDPTHNARALELFYQEHEGWKAFEFVHQHLSSSPIICRFAAPVQIPAGIINSGGVLNPLEVMLIEHNPGY